MQALRSGGMHSDSATYADQVIWISARSLAWSIVGLNSTQENSSALFAGKSLYRRKDMRVRLPLTEHVSNLAVQVE